MVPAGVSLDIEKVPFPAITQKSLCLIFWLGSRLKTKMARERGENTSEISPTETLKKC